MSQTVRCRYGVRIAMMLDLAKSDITVMRELCGAHGTTQTSVADRCPDLQMKVGRLDGTISGPRLCTFVLQNPLPMDESSCRRDLRGGFSHRACRRFPHHRLGRPLWQAYARNVIDWELVHSGIVMDRLACYLMAENNMSRKSHVSCAIIDQVEPEMHVQNTVCDSLRPIARKGEKR